MKRVCYLNPKVGSDHCSFIPSIVPHVSGTKTTLPKQICVGGKESNHGLLAQTLKTMTLENVHVSIFDRFNDAYNDVLEAYKEQQVDTTIVEPEIKRADYVAFHQKLSQCSLILPLMDPERNLKDDKWWSGLVASAIGYKIPAVVHRELEEDFQGLWTASIETYKDDAAFPAALQKALGSLDL
jgi:hypothetical protein